MISVIIAILVTAAVMYAVDAYLQERRQNELLEDMLVNACDEGVRLAKVITDAGYEIRHEDGKAYLKKLPNKK